MASGYTYPTRRILVLALVALVALAVASTEVALAGSGGIGSASEQSSSKPKQTEGTGNAVKYARIWEQTSSKDKRWAHRTAECESGGNPKAIGGGGLYRGAFQFMRETWATSPKSPGGDPIKYSYRTQAVVAVALMHRDGRGPWPVCG